MLAAGFALLASPAYAATARPDLSVAKLQADAASATLTVKNAGRANAKASQVALTLSKDAKASKDDRALTGAPVKALARKKSGSATVKLTVPAGTYRVIACADPKNKIRESNEKNNCRASGEITVRPGPQPAPGPAPQPVPQPAPNPGGPQPTVVPTATATVVPTVTATATPTATATVTPTVTATPTPDFPEPPLAPAQDPAEVAPEPEPTKPTTVADGTEFLYSGTNPIQKEVAPDTIEGQQVAVIRGKVLKADGTPMKGARVTVLDHFEFGYTSTREDGGYDLAVNGGADLTLTFEQEGFMSVQRTEPIPWQDYVDIADVVMTPYDTKVTEIEEKGDTLQVATSKTTPEDDADPRQATLLFEPGTDATMELPNGETKPLGDLEVRATEYTVGADGEEKMPGELPDSSAYTYAVEFSVDEAVDAGATDVKFTKPVTTYVDNFLGFEAGTIVPSAYYDEGKGAWVPSKNGLVIKILSESGGRANVDTDGDGTADNTGIDDAERQKLAQQYDAPKSLWRVEVEHFTPWDYNWPYGCRADCEAPDEEPPPPPYCPECEAAGSIIGVFNQTLGEQLSVPGTPFNLHYSSARVPGYKEAYRLDIPLTGASIKPGLRRVELQVTVAGREFRQTFTPKTNLSHTFEWDGKDAYGRVVEGAQNAEVRIGYVYAGEYLEPAEFEASFGQFGGAPVTRNESGADEESRREIIAWQEWERPIGVLGAGSDALGGWTLDAHHSYDPQSRTLYMGDGSRVTTEAIRSELSTAVGVSDGNVDPTKPSTMFPLETARGTDAGADGSIYVAETAADRVLKVDKDGMVHIVADEDTLTAPRDVAVADDGTLYISDTGNARIVKIDPLGNVSTFAGGGDPDTLGDGGAATQASLRDPRGLALAADGTLFIAEAGRDRVRRVAPDGRINTITTDLDLPTDVAVDAEGTIYIADALHHRVLRVTAQGETTTLAGNGGAGSAGDGGPATQAEIGQPYGIDVADDGTVYVSDRIHHVVRRIAKDGTIVTYAGTGRSGEAGDGNAPQQAQLTFPEDVTVAPDQSVQIADTGNARIRRASPGLPGFVDADFSLPSQDGTVVFQFDRTGRHVRTLDALTGLPRLTFGYDAESRLKTVTDADGNVVTIERDGSGKPTAIIAPGNLRTGLTIRPDGMLGELKNAENEAHTLDYFAGGLLKTFKDPLGHDAHFTYDAATGRLRTDEDKSGSVVTLTREQTATGYRIKRTSDMGKLTTFEAEQLPGGGTRSTTIDPSGAKSVMEYGADGVTRVTQPDGTVITTTLAGDPRWGMRAPYTARATVTTPDGRTKVSTNERTVELEQDANPFSIETLVDETTVNGKTSRREYDGESRTLTSTSPENREVSTVYDAKGRPVTHHYGTGVAPRTLQWDAKGRLAKVVQGGREITYGYDATRPQRLLTRTDGENHTVTYGYDNVERVTSVKLPSNATYGFTYDDVGNRTGVTMPNGKTHTYGFSPTANLTSYTAPGVAAQTRAYDDDHYLQSVTLPGRAATTYARTTDGRLTGVGEATFGYADATTRITSATRGAKTDAFSFDGLLKTTAGEYTYGYTADMELASIQLAGAEKLALSHDEDGMLTGYGPFTYERGGPLGDVSKITDDALSLAYAYDDGGAAKSRTLTVKGSKRYENTITRDDSGRITKRVETVNGSTKTYDYEYWPDGELKSVKDGATVLESYTYDANGNRGGRTYGDDDRMTGTHTYDAAGFLVSRGADTFTYGDKGELKTATVGGTTVTYEYDASRRLVARVQGGARTEFRYGDPSRPFQVTASRVGGELTQYFYDRGGLLFAVQRGGARYYVGADQVGTPRVITDANGAVVKTFATNAFGVRNKGAETGTFELPIGFSGGIEDPVTGLVRFGLRDYEPATGRFTAKDPILHEGGMNLFVYAGNDPVSRRDASGMDEGGGIDPGLLELPSVGDRIVGQFNKLVDWVKSEDGRDAIETVSELPLEDNPIVETAGKLNDGLEAIDTATEVVEGAFEIYEGEQKESLPEQAVAWLKCGLKVIDKVLPVNLTPTEAVEETFDQGLDHYRHQRDNGTIHRRQAEMLREIGMN